MTNGEAAYRQFKLEIEHDSEHGIEFDPSMLTGGYADWQDLTDGGKRIFENIAAAAINNHPVPGLPDL